MDIDREKIWMKWPSHMATDCVYRIMAAAVEIDEHIRPGSGCSIDRKKRDTLMKLNTEIINRADMMHSILSDLNLKEMREKGI